MPKARRRKDSSFETSVTKSVFLYGDPNKEKLALLKQMQDVFTALVNERILMLDAREDLIMQLVKNDKKDTVMRSLEKAARRKGLNSAFCQNAFDMAVTCLSNRSTRSVWTFFLKGQGSLPDRRSCLLCPSWAKQKQR